MCIVLYFPFIYRFTNKVSTKRTASTKLYWIRPNLFIITSRIPEWYLMVWYHSVIKCMWMSKKSLKLWKRKKPGKKKRKKQKLQNVRFFLLLFFIFLFLRILSKKNPNYLFLFYINLIYTFIKVKLAIFVKGDPEAPFSIATTRRWRGWHYSFPGLLYFTLDPYLIKLSVKQGSIKYHFWVFGMTHPRIESWSPGPLANTLHPNYSYSIFINL